MSKKAQNQRQMEIPAAANADSSPAGAATQNGKMFYKMGEVCKITGLESHVLRFWESEFSQLKPRKNRSGHRIFNPADIQLIQRIKTLLYDEGLTIAGAKKNLAGGGAVVAEKPQASLDTAALRQQIGEVKGILGGIVKMLDGL